MAKDLFATLDLNLLRTFLVLSQELNMRKASERLFVSQPAISQALQKLRNHFDDDLFVKSRNGMRATHFAEELAKRITPHMDALSNALNQSYEFDPEKIEGTVKIALASPVLFSLAGKLYQKLHKEAPNADIQFLNWGKNTCQEIENGEVLIAVNYNNIKTSKTISSRHLVDTRAVILVRKEHPITSNFVTPEEAVTYPIASLIIPDISDNEAESSSILNKKGLKHTVAFRSEFPFTVIDVVRNTDMLFPSLSAFPVEDYPYLRSIEIDIEDEYKYGYPLYSYFHLKNRNNPMVNWLHNLLNSLLR